MNEDKAVEIELRDSVERVTQADLEQIKLALTLALTEKESPDFAPLQDELANSACMVLPNGNAHIGGWRLQADASRQSLQLEHQPAQRSALMLFYVAPVQRRQGRWVVDDVVIRQVRGR